MSTIIHSVNPNTCTIADVYNAIQFKMTKLFIDTRPEQEYNKQHIRSAVNVPFDSPGLHGSDSNLLQSKIESFISSKSHSITKIIFYGNNKFNINDSKQQLLYQRLTNLLIQTIQQKFKSKIDIPSFINTNKLSDTPSIYILDTIYSQFESKYPFLCDNNPPSTNPNTAKTELFMDLISIYMNGKIKLKKCFKVYPSQIINDQYFLGNANHCRDDTILKNLGITHIINCSLQLPNKFERIEPENTSNEELKQDTETYSAKYIRVPILDVADQNINKYFIETIKFIENVLSENDNEKGVFKNKILCHCHAGISRSSTVTISYLMYAKNMSFIETLALLKSKRDIVNPNQGFRTQLVGFEKYLTEKRKLLGKSKLTMNDLNDFNVNDMNEEKEADIKVIEKELKLYVLEFFVSLNTDDISYFLDKYGSMINNQFPKLFGVLIEDVFLNENNFNRQLFILLVVELFKDKKITNINNHFVDNALCGYLAKDFHDNLIDCPYFLQFIGALFGQLFNKGYLSLNCLKLFCESSMEQQKLKILEENKLTVNKTNDLETDENGKIYMKRQFELAKFQCSKLILYTLKELELLNSIEMMSQFKNIKWKDIIVAKAFQKSDQQYLSYIN